MELIAITPPYFYPGEATAIVNALKSGFSRVHIRKPDSSSTQIEELLKAIPVEMLAKISLHDHHELAQVYGIGGIHLNKRNSILPGDWKGIVSVSAHSPEEVNRILSESEINPDYVFLSPIYSSLSKPGYTPRFSFDEMSKVAGPKVYALGGIRKKDLPELEEAGYGGAVLLTEAWHQPLDMEAFRLQFITHPTIGINVVDGARLALKGGCRWIQLRHKDASRETLIEEGKELSRLCRDYNAIFIIDDHVDLVNELQADGVHLGQNDMPVGDARKILGPSKIIGATANTFEQYAEAAGLGADYAGIGPFRFTTTKKNLSPILGLYGYKEIVDKKHSQGIRIPIVAIGGIMSADITSILESGIDGIALSSTILSSENPTETTSEITSLCKTRHKKQYK